MGDAREVGRLGCPAGGPMGSTGVIRGAKLRQILVNLRSRWDFFSQVYSQPFMVGTLQAPPSPG